MENWLQDHHFQSPIKDIMSCRSRWVTQFWFFCGCSGWAVPGYVGVQGFFFSFSGWIWHQWILFTWKISDERLLAVEMHILNACKKGEWFGLGSENWVGCLCSVSLYFSPVCECEFPLPKHKEKLQVSPGSLKEGAGRENRILGLGDSSDPVAVNSFGSLLLPLAVCVQIYMEKWKMYRSNFLLAPVE